MLAAIPKQVPQTVQPPQAEQPHTDQPQTMQPPNTQQPTDTEQLPNTQQPPRAEQPQPKSAAKKTTRSTLRPTTPTNDNNSESIRARAQDALNRIELQPQPRDFQASVALILKASTPSPLLKKNANMLNTRVETQNRSPFARKRRRNGDGGGGSGDGAGGAGRDGRGPVPPNNTETVTNQRALKRFKMSNTIRVQPQIDIIQLDPNPLRLTYKPHPLKDRSDAFYTEAFRRLFRSTEKMVSTYFCIHDLDQGEFFDPWADIDFTPEFINWAGQVAQPDPNTEGWDELLKETTQRKWLIMGLIMRILKVRVFDEDFFGANQQQKELLFGIERAFFTREGYSRTALRAETCRTIIDGNPVTENFYTQVAELTAKIDLLLQPLTRYLYALAPPPGKVLPKVQDLYQSLHNIVSTAAYLSLGIRLSPTIFHITEINPGAAYDSDDQHNLEQQLYINSKQIILDEHTSLYTDHHSPFETRERALTRELTRHPDQTSRAWVVANTNLINLRTAVPPPPSYSHRAMAKIAVWPSITRYKPGGAGEEALPLHEKDGFRIHTICKSAVVCYFGETDEEKRRKRDAEQERTQVRQHVVERETLRRFVREKKDKRARRRGERGFVRGAGVAAAVVAVAATATAAVLYGGIGVQQGADEVAGMIGNVMEYAGDFVDFVDRLGLMRALAGIGDL